jgi:hypothetical protein
MTHPTPEHVKEATALIGYNGSRVAVFKLPPDIERVATALALRDAENAKLSKRLELCEAALRIYGSSVNWGIETTNREWGKGGVRKPSEVVFIYPFMADRENGYNRAMSALRKSHKLAQQALTPEPTITDKTNG